MKKPFYLALGVSFLGDYGKGLVSLHNNRYATHFIYPFYFFYIQSVTTIPLLCKKSQTTNCAYVENHALLLGSIHITINRGLTIRIIFLSI